MSERTSHINQSLLRCHLVALIALAGSKVPPKKIAHPVVHRLSPSELIDYVELYRAFLRSPK